MKAIKLLAIVLGVYVGLVVAVESLVGIMGGRHVTRGVQPGETWLLISTTAADGVRKDAVVAGVESDGKLYVAANHWPRGWYNRAVENADVEITREGKKIASRAVPVSGEERVRIAEDYSLPWIVRLLTGFPPRSFLRLDPR